MKAPQVLKKLLKTVVTFLGTQRYFYIFTKYLFLINFLVLPFGRIKEPQVFRRVLRSYLDKRCTFSLLDHKILINYQCLLLPIWLLKVLQVLTRLLRAVASLLRKVIGK